MKAFLLLLIFTVFSWANTYVNADDIGFVDEITINGREFDSLPHEIEFYQEDLKNGRVIVRGLLESDDKNTPVEKLHVEITTDGGATWSRAKGTGIWTWSFTPQLEQSYEFSLRVVKESSEEKTDTIGVEGIYYIAGFKLTLDASVAIADGKISGSGTITIPYLDHFNIDNTIPVDFSNLHVRDHNITMGDITYNTPLALNSDIADIAISKIVISATPANNKVEGKITLKGFLSTLSSIDLSDTSKLLPNTFSLDIPVSQKDITIWPSKNVKLAINSGNVNVSYHIGDNLPQIDMSGLNATLAFGTLLTDVSDTANAITATLENLDENATDSYALTMNNAEAYLLGKKIKLSDFNLGLDISNYLLPKLSLVSKVDFSAYDNLILKQMRDATLSANISKNGMSASITLAAALPSMTILDRGGVGKDVKLDFSSQTLPSFSINIADTQSMPSFDLSGVSATLDFGDIIQSAKSEAGGAISSLKADIDLTLDETKEFSLNFSNISKAYLLGSNFALEGLDGNFKFNYDTKIISLGNISVNLDDYSDPILKKLSGSTISATISSQGFSAHLQADAGIDDITLLDRGGPGKDVILKVTGTPSVGVNISQNGIDFDFGELNAKVDFGDLLQGAQNSTGGMISHVVATLGNSIDNAKKYTLSFPTSTKVYLLGSNFSLKGINASFDLTNRSVHLDSTLDLTIISNPLLQAIKEASVHLDVSPSGFVGSISASGESDPITILDRGSVENSVRMKFITPPTIKLALAADEVSLGLSGGAAKLYFGDLLQGAEAQLNAITDNLGASINGQYDWAISGSKKLINDSKVLLTSLSGTLDISKLENPQIHFTSTADLHEYGGLLTSVDAINMNADISKEGFSASLSPHLTSVDIWSEKGVKLNFTQDPTFNIAISKNDFKMGLSNLHANLNFGTLLADATAEIQSSAPNLDGVNSAVDKVQELSNTAQNYTWSITGEHLLAGSSVLLKNLSGSIDLSDFSNPSIAFNALADLHNYGTVFEYVTNAGVENAMLSKSGFEATLFATLSDVDIWKDKNVKLLFNQDKPPMIKLSVTTSGLKIGFKDFSADVFFGDLLDNAKATLSSLSGDIYSWNLSGIHDIQGTSLKIKEMLGTIDLSDLKNPTLNVNGSVDLSANGGILENITAVSLENSTISKEGFKGDLSIGLNGFDVWPEKNVKVEFPSGTTPTVSLTLTRDDFKIGLSDINANINFGSLLDGEIIALSPLSSTTVDDALQQATKGRTMPTRGRRSPSDFKKIGQNISDTQTQKGIYKWSLQSSHTLLQDENNANKYVSVTSISGTIDLNNLLNPIITFDAAADFTHYQIGTATLGHVTLDDATISREGIYWNMAFEGAAVELTILDLGTRSEDVRIELSNIDGHASSSGSGGIDQADGRLYFGKLFDGNVEPIALTYQSSGTYSFSTNQVFTYKKGDNSVVLSGVSGIVKKVGSKYKVSLQGNSVVHAALLSQFNVGNLTIGNLEVSSSGFAGDISAAFAPAKVMTLVAGHASLVLSKVGVHIDSTKNIPLAINAFDGFLDLSPIFTESSAQAKALLSLVDSDVRWSMPHDLHINNDNFIFKNLSGSFDLESSLEDIKIGLNGIFSYKGIDNLALELNSFKISSSGLSGTIKLADGTTVAIPGVDGLKLSALSATFTPANIEGSAGLTYDKSDFLGSSKNLHVGLSSVIDRNGIKNFTVNTNALEAIEIPDFAKMTFPSVRVAPSFDDFWMSFNGTIKPTNAIFSVASELEYQGLKISKEGISIESAGMEFDVSGASGSLGGFSLSIEKLGLGFSSNKLFVSTKGVLSLASVAEAGAGLKLYSDGDVDVDSIKIKVSNPGVTFNGEIAWYKNDPIYGNGFGTLSPLQLKLANVFSVEGEFKIGEHPEKGFYWMAKAAGSIGGSGIPLGPLSIYGLGGGVVYNMSYTKVGKSYTFAPSGEHNSIIIFSALLGTPDMGYTWHGNVEMMIDTAGQFTINAERTYIISTKEGEPENRKVSGRIEYANSPASLHISASANITFFGIGLKAENNAVDILLSTGEKHIFVGQKAIEGFSNATNNPITITVLGLDASGYFMIDTRQLAFGLGYHFYKKWSLDWTGPNPWASAEVDAEAGALMRYNPFFMLMYAEAGATFSVGYAGLDTSLGADVKMELATPNPSYLWGKVGISALGETFHFSGYIYGSGRPDGGQKKSKLLFDHIEPYNEIDISVMPEFKIVSMFNKSITSFEDVKLTKKSTGVDVPVGIDKSYKTEPKEIIVIPSSPLAPDSKYTLSGTLHYHDNTEDTTENFKKDFKTTKLNRLEFSEIVASITPENGRTNVFEEEPVTIQYKEIMKYLKEDNELFSNYEVQVANSKNEAISGTYSYNSEHLRAYFVPATPLRIYHYCVRNSDGSVMETFKTAQGEYLNPFNGYKVDGAVGNDASPVTVPSRISKTKLENVNLGKYYDGSSRGSGSREGGDDESYSYYTNNAYNITVTDKSKNQIVYYSTFSVSGNNILKEEERRFDEMKDQLHPSLSISYNVNPARGDEARIEIYSDLDNIGITHHSILYKITTTWEVEGLGTVIKENDWNDKGKYGRLPEVRFEGHDIMALRRANITYYVDEGGTKRDLFTIENIGFVNGDAYSTAEAEEREAQVNDMVDKASLQENIFDNPGSSTPGGGLVPGGGIPGGIPGGAIPGGFDGGVIQNFKLGM
ncbi:hypothetical protein [Sulfurospirillum sp. 1612]|uniref:hypothetical protein n=1 Tax=Sulfurospirillum sp. 1612 TaxID=3094835 RepID=UPI002F94C9C9